MPLIGTESDAVDAGKDHIPLFIGIMLSGLCGMSVWLLLEQRSVPGILQTPFLQDDPLKKRIG